MNNMNHYAQRTFNGNLSDCLIELMEQGLRGGNHCSSREFLYQQFCKENGVVPRTVFEEEMNYQMELGRIAQYRGYCYLKKTWGYESFVAEKLAERLNRNVFHGNLFEPIIDLRGNYLSQNQKETLKKAIHHRIVLVTGGPPAYETTMINELLDATLAGSQYIVCSPIERGASRLQEHTGRRVETVPKALGIKPGVDFLDLSIWRNLSVFLVADAGMLTLEMLAGILKKTTRECRIILLGDDVHANAVGSRNILPQLVEIGVPWYRLEDNGGQPFREENLDNITQRKVMKERHSNLVKQVQEIREIGRAIRDKPRLNMQRGH